METISEIREYFQAKIDPVWINTLVTLEHPGQLEDGTIQQLIRFEVALPEMEDQNVVCRAGLTPETPTWTSVVDAVIKAFAHQLEGIRAQQQITKPVTTNVTKMETKKKAKK
jgi:hypothetical protein